MTKSFPSLIPCDDINEALQFFTKRLGFRVDMIVPADSPVAAVISGHGLSIRLEKSGAPVKDEESVVIDEEATGPKSSTISSGDWVTGRAGMQYRDLIPGRMNGRVIASHIRIVNGGVVPDYVHYHKIIFQMIYCKSGWIRVVYEDQGPPFILNAGDCVLQPPEIRHRVLGASAGAEVVEIGCPAIHETWAEHEIKLPTAQVLPDRDFGGQHFVRHIAAEAVWEPSEIDGLDSRDTGISAATNGLGNVRVLRPSDRLQIPNTVIKNSGGFLFFFVLNGEFSLDMQVKLNKDDAFAMQPGVDHSFLPSADLELLEVSIPYV